MVCRHNTILAVSVCLLSAVPLGGCPQKKSEPLPLVTFKIESHPSKAAVFERGRRIGVTPLTLKRQRGAQLSYELVKNRYKTARRTVLVQPKMPTLYVKLNPATATVIIDTMGIRGGRVTIGGLYRGRAPIRVEMPLGVHELVLDKPGLAPIKRTFELKVAGETKRLKIDLVEQLKKQRQLSGPAVTVISDRAARVTVGRKLLGTTPLYSAKLAPGTHLLVIQDVRSNKVIKRKVTIHPRMTSTIKVKFGR
jgi:hypothetical protein